MTKVRVKNTNIHPLTTLFKGETVTIKAGDYWRDDNGQVKELDIFEANDFRGQYHPAPLDEGTGKLLNDPRFFKMVSIEPVGVTVPMQEPSLSQKCMAPSCKHVAANAAALKAHTQEAHASIDTLIMPEEDEQIEAKKPSRGKQG